MPNEHHGQRRHAWLNHLLVQIAIGRPLGTLLCRLWRPLQQPFQVAREKSWEVFWAAAPVFGNSPDNLWVLATETFSVLGSQSPSDQPNSKLLLEFQNAQAPPVCATCSVLCYVFSAKHYSPAGNSESISACEFLGFCNPTSTLASELEAAARLGPNASKSQLYRTFTPWIWSRNVMAKQFHGKSPR